MIVLASDHPRCGVPSERVRFVLAVPGVAPRAGMPRPVGAVFCSNGATPYQQRATPWFPIPGGGGSMIAAFRMPQRGNAYQPRVQRWVSGFAYPRVLKERCISSDGRRMPDQCLCGVPSERMDYLPPVPGALPRAGMHRPVGPENVFGVSSPGALPRAGMHRPVGA